MHRHDQRAHVIGIPEKTVEVDGERLVVLGDHSRIRLAVFHLQRILQARSADAVSGQSRRIRLHEHGAPLASDELRGGYVGNLLQIVPEFCGGAPDLVSIQLVAPQRKRQKRDVVDGTRLDQRLRSARRNQVKIREHLLIQPDDALFFVLAHVKADNRHARAGAGGRIDIFDARDFPEQALHRPGDPGFHFLGRCSRKGDHDVDHRNDDLRLLFPGKHKNSGYSERNRGQQNQRRKLRVDEGVGQSPCHLGFAHGFISTVVPSVISLFSRARTFSPGSMPERTSEFSAS